MMVTLIPTCAIPPHAGINTQVGVIHNSTISCQEQKR